MFQRFRSMREEREGGFTLIELLVVILIIAILAAIAIPVFLNQRKKGWESQAESAVKNLATAQESYATGNDGKYTGTLSDLQGASKEGFTYSASELTVKIIYPAAGATATDGYCLHAESKNDTSIDRWYASGVGSPQSTACTGPTG